MAVENALTSISVPAGSDLSSKQYYFMTINSSGQLAATGDGAAADGVLQDAPAAAGRAGRLGTGGRTKITLGGTVSAGDDVASDSTGKAVVAATGDIILGTAITGGSSGVIGDMLFQPRGAAT